MAEELSEDAKEMWNALGFEEMERRCVEFGKQFPTAKKQEIVDMFVAECNATAPKVVRRPYSLLPCQ